MKAGERAQKGLVRIRATIDRLKRFALAEEGVLELDDGWCRGRRAGGCVGDIGGGCVGGANGVGAGGCWTADHAAGVGSSAHGRHR